MQNLAKKKSTFLQDIPFIRQVYVSIIILVNAISCKKENDCFARYAIY